jgi:hypothetical protein
MFHELLTIKASFQQFTHFNGLFQGLLSEKLLLCARETFEAAVKGWHLMVNPWNCSPLGKPGLARHN